MSWSRTIRFDRVLDKTEQQKIAAAFPASVSVRFGDSRAELGRTYALVLASSDIDAEPMAALVPQAHWFDGSIIVLAIEPAPADALRAIHGALSGDGAPAAIFSSASTGNSEIVEFDPARVSPALVMKLVDVELRRFHGYRKVSVLAPMSAAVVAAVAAEGLQAPEISPGRILETLLEQSRVE